MEEEELADPGSPGGGGRTEGNRLTQAHLVEEEELRGTG